MKPGQKTLQTSQIWMISQLSRQDNLVTSSNFWIQKKPIKTRESTKKYQEIGSTSRWEDLGNNSKNSGWLELNTTRESLDITAHWDCNTLTGWLICLIWDLDSCFLLVSWMQFSHPQKRLEPLNITDLNSHSPSITQLSTMDPTLTILTMIKSSVDTVSQWQPCMSLNMVISHLTQED